MESHNCNLHYQQRHVDTVNKCLTNVGVMLIRWPQPWYQPSLPCYYFNQNPPLSGEVSERKPKVTPEVLLPKGVTSSRYNKTMVNLLTFRSLIMGSAICSFVLDWMKRAYTTDYLSQKTEKLNHVVTTVIKV